MFKKIFERLTQRPLNAHKYNFGHVLVIGGSPGMVGAPFLSAMAAIRTGAGLVTIASTADVIDKLEERVVEIMTFRLAADHHKARAELTDYIQRRKINTIIVGPGIDASLKDLITDLAAIESLPIVLDGGALGYYINDQDKLSNRGGASIIITPHAGEFEKLTSQKVSDNHHQAQRQAADLAKQLSLIVVLKGHNTIVASPEQPVYVNQTGNPGMATAGSGDVLAGIIGGLLAQHIPPYEAAKTGVYLHGLAGDLAAKQLAVPGMIAEDIIANIPAAYKSIKT